jgi:hypothetical protein
MYGGLGENIHTFKTKALVEVSGECYPMAFFCGVNIGSHYM